MGGAGLGEGLMKRFAWRWIAGLVVASLALRGAAQVVPFWVCVPVALLWSALVASTYSALRMRGLRVRETTWQLEVVIMLAGPVAVVAGLTIGLLLGFLLHATMIPVVSLAAAGLISGAVWASATGPVPLQTRLTVRSGVGGAIAGAMAVADYGLEWLRLGAAAELESYARATVTGLLGLGLVQAALLSHWAIKNTWKHMACRRCEYDLTGNTGGVCPECGTPVGAGGAE